MDKTCPRCGSPVVGRSNKIYCTKVCKDRDKAAEYRSRVAKVPCDVDGCDRPRSPRKGLCSMHYRRLRECGEVGPAHAYTSGPKARDRGPCDVDGCERPEYAKGLCNMHHGRLLRTGDVGPAAPLKNPKGTPRLEKSTGYIYVGKRGQHRIVMEEMLGRPLERFENVHHLNGRRDDNRPENLELWVKPQPAGQRPVDLVDWVCEHYPDLVAERMTQ